MVVMYRDVPTKTGVKEINVQEQDISLCESRGWKVKGKVAEPKASEPKPVEKVEEKKEASDKEEKKSRKWDA